MFLGSAAVVTSTHTFIFLEIFSREGGIQSYVKDILRAYQQSPGQGADIFLLRDAPSVENPLERKNSNLTFHYFGSSSGASGRLRLATDLGLHLLRNRPQRVICGHINLAPLVFWLCRTLGIPYVVMTFGKEVWNPLPGTARKALQQAFQVWFISRYSRDQACQANQLDAAKAEFLPCVVDATQFEPGPAAPHLLERYGLERRRVLMTVARLWPGDIYKGVDVTIRALPAIAVAFPNVSYLVIGRGEDQPRLAQLAQDLGVADRVIFAGFIPTAELPDHYRLAHGYVMPSQEGFGIVYLEAMASGVPVVSGDNDGSADPLQDGRLGWRVPHRDPAAVATACIELLRGEDQRCQGSWLRQEALAKFSVDSLSKQLRQLLTGPEQPPAP